ncbi:ribonucleoside-diphosphate reductase I subunit beta [Bajunvirus bajun]|uniref:ribonucleoside-diphosphate reductase n=1 Tax=Brevundimonas phage vB_BgoS-Bajun TaxID=2948594 RepID=A0A9E7SRR4_9CAUD|nr:ribonucleoside-diphosphate reductase I subunit beta [Brevundimonas phage vB_BgoS-Bajun]
MILESRDFYKPFSYPWAFEAYEVMQAMHWLPHESPMADDLLDWNTKLTVAQREFLTQLFRFFTQADVDVAAAYIEKYLPRFKHPELRMMLSSFATAEANHIHAYSTLIDTLGIPESEYQAFQAYEAMREKHEYMAERETGKSIADLVVDIAVFSAFGEGMQLFSSFALLMNFQRQGLMKGMTTIVEWSIRDESHHVASMIKLMHAVVKEHPRTWNDETKKRIYQACRDMVTLEDAFIDQAYTFAEVDASGEKTMMGVTIGQAKEYIRYIADRRLIQLGLKPNYGQKENPFPWLDWIMNAPTHTNFFEGRSTEYGKGGVKGWDKAFAFMDHDRSKALLIEKLTRTTTEKSVATTYRILTMPDCPHCVRAKALASDKGLRHEVIQIDDRLKREEIKKAYDGWKTFPMVFEIDSVSGDVIRFVGGADAFTQEVNGAA